MDRPLCGGSRTELGGKTGVAAFFGVVGGEFAAVARLVAISAACKQNVDDGAFASGSGGVQGGEAAHLYGVDLSAVGEQETNRLGVVTESAGSVERLVAHAGG